MGKRGPKPKPTALKLLDGHAPTNMNEPTCGHPAVMPPTVGADAIAAAEWVRLRDVCPPGLYSAMDTGALTQYCLAWSMLLRSQEDLNTRGLIIEVPIMGRGVIVGTDVTTNPAARTWKSASETLLKCCDRLGLVPSARTRLQLPSSQANIKSKFDGLLGKPTDL